eukprot:SAG31_NODE_2967_length_4841_cov_4.952552_6_plen_120_part_00
MFDRIDKDGDGSLSQIELSSGLSDFGLMDEQIEMLFFQLDANSDGRISLDEWLGGFGKYTDTVAKVTRSVSGEAAATANARETLEKRPAEALGPAVVAYAQSQLGKGVHDGECWALAKV